MIGKIARFFFKFSAPDGQLKTFESKVTFVVQGSIADRSGVEICVSSIRKQFPEAKIILSTFLGSALYDLEVDNVVYSADPGAVNVDDVRNIKYNINRQLVSSLAGVKIVTTQYCVKVRTDSYFSNNKLLRHYLYLSGRWGPSVDGTARIMAISDFYRNPRRFYKMPYHMSDFLYVSSTENMLTLFSCPHMLDFETRWYATRKMPKIAPSTTVLHRYSAEQHIWLNYLNSKNQTVKLACAYDDRKETIVDAESAIRNFALVVPSWRVGLQMSKSQHRWMYLRSFDSYSVREISSIMSNRPVGSWFFDGELIFLRFVSLHSLVKRKVKLLLKKFKAVI